MSELRVSNNIMLQLVDWLDGDTTEPPPAELIAELKRYPGFIYLMGHYELWRDAVRSVSKGWPEWYISPVLDLLSPIGDSELRHRFRSDPRTKA